MLNLIGLGYSIDPTLSSLHLIKNSDAVFLEAYTSPVSNKIKEEVESKIGREVKIIKREKVESDYLIKIAKENNISLLVVGDPLFATTHISLMLEAKRNNVKVNVVNNASIFNAVGKTGLSLYKFGRTVTISYWRENYRPTSPIKFIQKNKSIGLHTLALLDVSEDKGPMDAKEGINLIKKMEEKEGIKVVDKLVVLSRMGRIDEKITYGSIDELLNVDLGKPLFCFVIPGQMNRVEEEFLLSLSNHL